jgi:hypothetical protein
MNMDGWPGWNDQGLHYVAKVGQRCRILTYDNGTYWIAAVRGHFSSSGDTEAEAIENAKR